VVTRLIRRAQEDGLVGEALDVRLLSNCLFAVVVSSHRWYRRGSKVDREHVVDHCTGFVLRGLAGDRGDDRC
jgi:hypothetical protein